MPGAEARERSPHLKGDYTDTTSAQEVPGAQPRLRNFGKATPVFLIQTSLIAPQVNSCRVATRGTQKNEHAAFQSDNERRIRVVAV